MVLPSVLFVGGLSGENLDCLVKDLSDERKEELRGALEHTLANRQAINYRKIVALLLEPILKKKPNNGLPKTMKRPKISKTEKSALLFLRPPRHGAIRSALLLAALVLTFACAVPQARAGFDEGVAAYHAGNFKLASEESLKAEEQGDAEIQYFLGWMYDKGEGVTRDYAEAVRWYRRAAAQGHAIAQFNLGVMYAKGEGVTRNYAEAVRWYRRAAEQGEATAQNNLGLMYDRGEGVTRDYAEAVRWYRRAAAQGYATAQNNLGVMYSKGEGVTRDYAEAVRWYRRAAEQGDAAAQFNLGVMYAKGHGVPRNYIEAYMWYSLAAAQSDDVAVQNLNRLEKLMTPAQIAAAQERARNWRPSSGGESD